MRWNQPQIGRVPPGDFLPAIQGTGVMAALGDHVIERAVRDMLVLDAKGHALDVAVNVATEHFTADGFVARAAVLCEREGYAPGRLQFEVSEEAVHSPPGVFERAVDEAADWLRRAA